MKPKELKFHQNARTKLLAGTSKVCNTVGATLGPISGNVAIDRDYGTPWVIHDGVQIAKQIKLKDRYENLGAQLLIEAAQKTNDNAGDGTTGSIVLGHAIFEEGLKYVNTGHNAMVIRRGILKGAEALSKALKEKAVPITKKSDKSFVATISAQDKEIGDMIIAALQKVGDDGVVTVEESSAPGIVVDYKEGMQFQKGFVTPHFITNPEKLEATLKNPVVVIADRDLNNYNDLEPLLKSILGDNKKSDIVFIARSISSSALQAMIINKIQMGINFLPINAPYYQEKQRQFLDDMAVLTGATLIEDHHNLQDMSFDDCGSAAKVTAGENQTIILGNNDEQVNSRIAYLKEQLERSDLQLNEAEMLKERLAKLTSGVAVINVGGYTEAETKEKTERVIDAISATKAAIETGIVAGGETALIQVQDVLNNVECTGGEVFGINILKEAIKKPFYQLLDNSGANPDREIDKVLKGKGYNVVTGKSEDLLKTGVVDPLKVVDNVLINAATVATTLLTCDVVMVEYEDNGRDSK